MNCKLTSDLTRMTLSSS